MSISDKTMISLHDYINNFNEAGEKLNIVIDNLSELLDKTNDTKNDYSIKIIMVLYLQKEYTEKIAKILLIIVEICNKHIISKTISAGMLSSLISFTGTNTQISKVITDLLSNRTYKYKPLLPDGIQNSIYSILANTLKIETQKERNLRAFTLENAYMDTLNNKKLSYKNHAIAIDTLIHGLSNIRGAYVYNCYMLIFNMKELSNKIEYQNNMKKWQENDIEFLTKIKRKIENLEK